MKRAALLLATSTAVLLLAALPAVATMSAPAGVAAAAAQDGKTVDAKIIDFNFSPAPLRVEVGTTVKWTNTGARPHTATDRGGTFDTKPISPGKSGSVTFSVPGRYQYFCRINPAKMNGEVIVTAAEPAKVNRIQAFDPALPGKKLSFDPSKLEVPVGSTLLLANVGGKPHTITADDGSFDSGIVNPGAEGGRFAGNNATITLNKAGSFPFHCEIHPAAMKGVLTVTGEEGAAEDQGGEDQAQASNAPAKTSIDMQDFAFDPAEVSVAPAGKVTWKNTGQAPHTATFDDIPLDTKTIEAGGDVTLTAPSKPGSYSYKCNIHPGQMRAVLVVVGQNVADPTAKKKEPVAREVAKAAATADDGGGGGGPGGGVSWFALTTGVIGAFAAGFGISAFVRGRSDTT
jgi:plastocyanin